MQHASIIILFYIISGWTSSLPSQSAAPTSRQVIEQFIESLPQSSARFAPEQLAFVQARWQQLAPDSAPPTFIPEMLSLLEPRFRTGLDAFSNHEYSLAIRLLTPLVCSDDPYLSAHAAAILAQAALEQSQLAQAQWILQFALQPERDPNHYTLLADQLWFMYGYVAAQRGDTTTAQSALQYFLEHFPEAESKLRDTARLLLDQPPLSRRDLSGVVDQMDQAYTRLDHGEINLDTQTHQYQALLLLEDLIRQAKDQEQQSQQNSSSGAGSQAQQTPTSPARQSTTPTGAAGPTQLHSAPNARPGEVWGQMPPQEREKIMQSLQQSFPVHYRELIEQYYEQLSKEE
ncbi:MAG: hypothetical protein HJJLKODD_01033 [Phycisphaerae bacterium]|nr:hypothetical protein [Phycisphaerae bacterium]